MSTSCKRCLLKQLGGPDYFATIYDYIAALPDEIKTQSTEYDRRLAICLDCDCLINGMCRLCGCFVEVRAAKKHQSCPKDDTLW